jgi:hypothetical protein
MARFDKHTLEYIRESVRPIDAVKTLFQERGQAIENLQKQRSKTVFVPEPRLTRKDDLTLPSTRQTKGLNRQEYQEKNNALKSDYDQKIFDTARDHFDKNHPKNDVELLDNLGQEDLSILLEENGVEKVHTLQVEREAKAPNENLNIDDLDLKMDDAQADQIFNDIDRAEEPAKNPAKDIDPQQEPTAELNLIMDQETTDKVFNNYQIQREEFKDNSKELTAQKVSKEDGLEK